jgi:hypothetical protein
LVHQVSPDLYGDNNTRLFTYWTVSITNSVPCAYIINVFQYLIGRHSCLDVLTLTAALLSYYVFPQSDAYQATGCYNILCSGFIQINSEIAMGASIFPISNYAGSQYDISILIWKVSIKQLN